MNSLEIRNICKILRFDNRSELKTYNFCRFDIADKDFFTQDIRIAVVRFILERTSFTGEPEMEDSCIGVQKLLDDKIYKGAYPLHDVRQFSTRVKIVPGAK